MRLIVNADDLGMCTEVNEAAARCLDAGCVTSVSILANGPCFDEAVRLLRAWPEVSVGVHLNLTEFAPLTAATHPPPTDTAAVREELVAQVLRVQEAGLRVTHFDSHQHLHYRLALFGVLKSLQRRFDVHRIRGIALVRTDREVDPLRAARQRLRAATFRLRLRAFPPEARTTAAFGSVTVLRGLRRPLASFEAMAHPGNPCHARYAEETAWLFAGGLRTLPFPVTPIGWHEL